MNFMYRCDVSITRGSGIACFQIIRRSSGGSRGKYSNSVRGAGSGEVVSLSPFVGESSEALDRRRLCVAPIVSGCCCSFSVGLLKWGGA